MEGKTSGVLGEDPGLDGPDPGGGCCLDQGVEQEVTDALPLSVGVDVDGVLDDPGVAGPVGDPAGRHPASYVVTVGGDAGL